MAFDVAPTCSLLTPPPASEHAIEAPIPATTPNRTTIPNVRSMEHLGASPIDASENFMSSCTHTGPTARSAHTDRSRRHSMNLNGVSAQATNDSIHAVWWEFPVAPTQNRS